MKIDGFKNICLMTLVGLVVIGLVFSTVSLGQENGLDNAEPSSEELMQNDLKEKIAYFHNQTGTVNGNAGVDTMNTTMGQDQYLSNWVYDSTITYDWYLDPPFAGEFQLKNESTIYMWINTREAEGGTNDVTLTLNLYEVGPAGGETLIANGSDYYGSTRTIFNEYSVSANTGEYNVSAGSSLRAELVIESSDNFQKRIAYGDSEYPSRVEMGTTTYVQPETFTAMNSTYNEKYNFPLNGNETIIHFNASITDPFGGYDIHGVFLTIEGPGGTVFYRNNMTLVEGTDTSYRQNYTYEWNYTGAQEGEYTAIVSAVDKTGYNYRYPDNPGDETYGGHLESKERTLWLGAERYYVHLRTLDSQAQIMEGAEVQVLSTNGTIETYNHTDEQGITNLSMKQGESLVRVYWQDVLVNETSVEIQGGISRDNAIDISCEVYTPTYRVVDVANEPIENVNLQISHPNGSTFREITGSDGTAEVPQLPTGQYSIRSEWLTKVVDQRTHSLNSNGMIQIDASVHYLDVGAYDERGRPVSDVHLTFRYDDTERVADADLTEVDGNVTMRLPETTDFAYDIVSRWRGVSVGDVQDVGLNGNNSVNIQLEIYYVDLHAMDSTQQNGDLNGADIRVYNDETGALANSNVTDQDGMTEVRLPSGDHTFEVYWKGIQVAAESRNVVQNMDVQDITCDVFNLEVEVEDDKGRRVENARVEVRHQGRLLAELRTEQNGITPETRLPQADLTIRVDWRGVQVYEDTYYLVDNSVENVTASIYHVHFTIEDHHGEPLGDASIALQNRGSLIATGSADGEGMISMRLPGGVHFTQVEWKGVMVYEDAQTIEASENVTVVVTDVYHVNFQGLDSEDVPVDRASIVTTIGTEQIDSGMTEEGIFKTRVPTPDGEPGNVTVTVYWRDVKVYEGTETVLHDRSVDHPIELDLDIYYLEYDLVDAEGEPVENARVFVRHSEISEGRDLIADKATDEYGRVEFRLPRGEQNLTARWKEVTVAVEENLDLNSNDRILVSADIHYLDIKVMDDRGESLSGAEVRITYPGVEKLYQSQQTDMDGQAVTRIPVGEWDVEVRWIDTEIYSDSFSVDEDSQSLELQTDVHYLTVVTTDSDGEELSDVHVRVVTEDRVWSGYTEDGNITFRLPARDDYTIEASYETTYMLTNVDVNETASIQVNAEEPEETLSFDDYPIPFYRTNLFMFIGVLIVMLALIGYLFQREPGVELEEEEETEEELEDEEEETEFEEDIEEEEETDEEYIEEEEESTE